MTNEQALLALLENRYDKDGLVAIAVNDPDKWIADCVDHECGILKNRADPLLS
jgi:hypothetical protein